MTDALTTQLSKVMGSIGALAKDKSNSHFNYDYMSEEAVKKAVQAAMVEHGIVPDKISMDIVSDIWSSGDKPKNLVKVKCTIHFGDATYEGLGAGSDGTDKALMKAQTAAIREAWKNCFCIPSGGDPEASGDDKPAESKPAGKPQRQQSTQRSGGGGDRHWVPRWDSFGEHAGKVMDDTTPEWVLEDVVKVMSADKYQNDAKWGEKNRAAQACAQRLLDAHPDPTGGGGPGDDSDGNDPGFSDDDF